MNLEQYRTLFIVVTLGLALLAASPVLGVVVSFEGGSEKFSEFWLLGPNHVANDYPFAVGADETYRIFVGVGNHMGSSEYYKVFVKFRNSTQSLPDVNGSEPSSLPPLYESMFFVADEEVWESPMTFGFKDVSVEGDVLSVGDVIVNGVTFPVDASAIWDSERGGFYFQLFFELWRYDVGCQAFRFHDRFVGLLLNLEGS